MGGQGSGKKTRREMMQIQSHKDKIQTTRLINRLEKHILAKNEKDIMQPSQVTAALGLIKKTVPDLQSVQHGGDSDNPLRLIIETGVPSADRED